MKKSSELRPWAALWSLVLGFFMILVDTTIVAVANPTIMQDLNTTMTATLWATSAYLLAYAVPLLITGRLGDRFGPKRMYLIGLTTFTLSSVACGFAPTIEVLIWARVVQGLGAAMMTPQTMSVITRIFAPRERGSAMAVWGVTAGVAMLVGPILGGFLLDGLGWQWIFYINIPVGIIGFVLAVRFVPKLETNARRLDVVGVILSGIGMFLLVFGLQEGESYAWGEIWGPITVWRLVIVGVIVLVLFVVWQRVQRGEPLMPLQLFGDRNFSIGSATIVTVGLTMTSMSLPLMFFLQLVRGLTPTQSALMLVPMAVISMALARPIGNLVDRRDSRKIATFGLILQALGLTLYIVLMNAETPIWVLLLPGIPIGIANSMIWGPLASISTFGLNLDLAGAGSGVYNTSRQVGAVLGTAAMASLMQMRLSARLGEQQATVAAEHTGGLSQLPEALRSGYASAMADSLLLPAVVILIGAVITLFFAPRPKLPV